MRAPVLGLGLGRVPLGGLWYRKITNLRQIVQLNVYALNY
jgi:hypothetical protein